MNTESKSNSNISPRVESHEYFLVPEGYFEDTESIILNRVKTGGVKRRISLNYGIAAVIALAVLFGGYGLYTRESELSQVELSEDDLAMCLTMENADHLLVAEHLFNDGLLLEESTLEMDETDTYLLHNDIDAGYLIIEQ